MRTMFDEPYYRNNERYTQSDLRLDYHSILAHIDTLMETSTVKHPYSSEEINDCLNALGDLYNSIQRTVNLFAEVLPQRVKRMCEFEELGIYWFNAAAALSNRTDMEAMLENQNKQDAYEYKAQYKAKSVAVRAIETLNKAQQFLLLHKIFSILLQYRKLALSIEVMTAVDGELTHFQAFVKNSSGGYIPPEAAYLL